MKDETPPLMDLLKPLSAKVGRQKFSPGGREITTRGSSGDGNRLALALKRRAEDQDRRKGGQG